MEDDNEDKQTRVESELHTAGAYDRIAKRYADVWFANPSMENANRFLKNLGQKARILDVGCGPGQYAKLFSDRGHDVLGIDISDNVLNEARQRVPYVEFAKMSMFSLEYSAASFDALWVCSSLVHIPASRLGGVLAEFGRVLKSGGFIFLNFQIGESNRIETPEEFDRDGEFGRFFQRYKNEECFTRYLGRARFYVEDRWEVVVSSNTLMKANDKSPRWLNVLARKGKD